MRKLSGCKVRLFAIFIYLCSRKSIYKQYMDDYHAENMNL